MIPITFLTAGLAAGAALAAVPVILHMFMRQTPKHVIFPALRLVKERQKRAKKRLKVKNWLLLAARMALIALMAMALARPTVYSKVPLGDQEVPTALALVFDTSLSMDYTERDKSRLDEAKARALELLAKSHESSQVFVIDSAEPGGPIGLSPSAARKRVEGRTTVAVNRPLNASIALAYKLVAASDRPRREVFVLTDFARSAWEPGQAIEGLATVRKAKGDVGTYLLRLSAKEIKDAAVVEAEPAEGIATQDEPVAIKVRIRASGAKQSRVAEFRLDGEKRGEKPVDLPSDGESELTFTTPAHLAEGLHRGEVRLSGEPDPLKVDDVRYFSIDVHPALKVLVVADEAIDGDFVAYTLEPSSYKPGDPRQFKVDRAAPSQLETRYNGPLKDYAAIFVNNVKTLPESQWARLSAYVREGGGLVIGLGRRCDPASYGGDAAASLIPAKIVKQVAPPGDFYFGKADVDNPLYGRLRNEVLGELARVPIYKYTEVTANQGARVLLSYQDGAPALIEKVVPGAKPGHVMLWTTPLSRRPDANSPDAWNEFPMPTVGWSFFYLMNQTVPYLAGVAGERLDYEAGEDVTLRVDAGKKFNHYAIQAPESKASDTLGEPVGGALVISAAPQVGQWDVTATGPGGLNKKMGFSVNVPRGEMQFAPIEAKELDALLGKDKYSVADSPESLKRVIKDARVGFEIFPPLMLLLLGLLTAENFLANRFYKESARAKSTTP